jgi:hypothetical protein
MSVGPDESELLTAFARAASKAQEVEALLRDTIIGVEVVNDTRNRPFAVIVRTRADMRRKVTRRRTTCPCGTRRYDLSE